MHLQAGVDPHFAPLWAMLRGSGLFWHRTSPGALEQILTEGEIKPNDGQFSDTFGQSKVSYGRHLRAVSLFDFDSGSESEIFDEKLKWGIVLIPASAPSVLIGLRKDLLDTSKLLTAAQIAAADPRLDALPEKIRSGRMVIPVVETLHLGSIPVRAISHLIFAARTDGEGYQLKKIAADEMCVCAIHGEATRWATDEQRKERERRASGDLTLADLIHDSFLVHDQEGGAHG